MWRCVIHKIRLNVFPPPQKQWMKKKFRNSFWVGVLDFFGIFQIDCRGLENLKGNQLPDFSVGEANPPRHWKIAIAFPVCVRTRNFAQIECVRVKISTNKVITRKIHANKIIQFIMELRTRQNENPSTPMKTWKIQIRRACNAKQNQIPYQTIKNSKMQNQSVGVAGRSVTPARRTTISGPPP